MENERLYILPEDRAAARARIAELEKEIQELGPEFYDVFNQSSETWHDNAPFDALRDRQSLMSAELQNLKMILRRAHIEHPEVHEGIVGTGARVTVMDAVSMKETTYLIAGDWTLRAGEDIDGAYLVSAKAPIAQVLMGKQVGDTAHFKKPLVILRIEY